MNFFIMVAVLSVLAQLTICIVSDILTPTPASDPYNDTVQRLFYNTPEENERLEKAIRSRSFFQSLITNVVLVLIVLLCYWLC